MVIPVHKQILTQAKVHTALLWMALIRYSNITFTGRGYKRTSLSYAAPQIQIHCNYKNKNNPYFFNFFGNSLALLLTGSPGPDKKED